MAIIKQAGLSSLIGAQFQLFPFSDLIQNAHQKKSCNLSQENWRVIRLIESIFIYQRTYSSKSYKIIELCGCKLILT